MTSNGMVMDSPPMTSKEDEAVGDDKPKRSDKTDGNASFLRAARAGNLDKVLEYLKGSTDINTSNANGLNALHLASKEGHVKVVTELLNRGANVDAATKKGNTALHIASLAGQEQVARILVEHSSKVNVQSQNGFTPLYMAAQENHSAVVKFLLANGANQSLATEDGFTPLAVALQQGHDKVVAVLLENDSRGRVRLPALHIAAKKDDVKAATLLLQNEHNVDNTSKSGFTPLHIASHYGNQNVGALLLEKGADPDYQARNNISPLHVAGKWGRHNMVTLLLDNRAKIESRTRDGLTPLHCGARSGHEQVVDLFLERGAPVNAKTKNGLSPLHMAAQGDHADCARLLLFHKATINDVTVDYLTPLHVAAHCGNVRTAKLLLDRKCEVNARALNGFTPLHIACKKNRIKVVELLLKYGGSIEATTESGLTPLHVSAFMGHMNIVIFLIQHGATIDTPTVRGETALHLAARANQTDIIRILLRHGAQVDAKAREDQTPLHIASRLGNVDNVVLLLQHGASPNATTKDNYTPLHIAAKEGHEEVASVLLDHGASKDLTTKKGFTPLHIAAKYGQIKVARLLLQKGADSNIQGKNGLTPLHVATHYNHPNVAVLLLESKASPHATAKNGYTPLHIAAKKNQMDIATTLLEYSAQPDAESRNGFTPLHLASQEGHTDMVSLLLEHKGNVNCRARNGLTPMHLAAQEDKVPVAEVLAKYDSEVDRQTKAGYTPLHTACHFGQINMIRYLLEQGASVNATTKVGYTPLHQAAQQGHVLVINLLLKYKASPNAVTNSGQTPLSIAQRLGYISVVETLKNVTEVTATPAPGEEKYKVVSPETMQENFMTDSEDEGGDESSLADSSYQYLTTDDMKILADDSISPRMDDQDYNYFDRYSTASTNISAGATLEHPGDGSRESFRESYQGETDFPVFESLPQEKLEASVAAPSYASMPPTGSTSLPPKASMSETMESRLYGSSYSGASFASSFDPDNITVDRHPVYSGFLVSFMVDARGGAMRGCRHSGVRIIVPPGKACMPTRVTCKLVKKEKLIHPPPLMDGEALASRILQMGPIGAKFNGPVVIEVPHFASLRGKEREIFIMRSDNGETWRDHSLESSDDAVQQALGGSFEDLESAEDLYQKRVTRILTTDFPQYFAVVTRIRQETQNVGPDGGMLSSSIVPQVQAVFPEGALTKKIKVGLQAQPIQPEVVAKMLGNRVAVSPIVTVEPRRRKFHKPITLTIPVPKASQKGMLNQYGGQETPTLRLLCSITGTTTPAQWEDITGTTPLTFVNDCVSFTTTVSARFWLMDCQNIGDAANMATELYRESSAVPFMSKFVVFSKPHTSEEARLRVFCMTDDRMDKTLEQQEHFSEVARSRDVEVLEGKPQYLEMGGNLVPVTKSGEQLYINFHGFRENRLPFLVRVRDGNQDPLGRIAFMREPKVARGEAPQNPICTLNITLNDLSKAPDTIVELEPDALRKKYELMRTGAPSEEQILKGELRLTDIADTLQGDWVVLARQLNISDEEIIKIQTEYTYVSEQALIMLHLWVQKSGEHAAGNNLERALQKIGREDVIRKCMYNSVEVTDAVEKAVAKMKLDSDQAGFEEFQNEIGTSRDSTMERGLSLDVSYDEQDIIKESESAAEESGSDGGDVVLRGDSKRVDEDRPISLTEDQITAEVDARRGVLQSTDEEPELAKEKQHAYMMLAQQMDDTIDFSSLQVDIPNEDKTVAQEERLVESQRPGQAPIAELIESMEGSFVEGMDDRVSISSEEGAAASKPPPKKPRKVPIEEAIRATKVSKVEGMDDRMSLSSEEGGVIVPTKVPVTELIQRIETAEVMAMDDRRSLSSEEDSMIVNEPQDQDVDKVDLDDRFTQEVIIPDQQSRPVESAPPPQDDDLHRSRDGFHTDDKPDDSQECVPVVLVDSSSGGIPIQEDHSAEDSFWTHDTTSLGAPEIAIQEASPLVQSPAEDDALSTGVYGEQVDLDQVRARAVQMQDDRCSEDDTNKVDTFLVDEAPATSGSQVSQLESQNTDTILIGDDDVENIDEDRPLSPTDYTLEAEAEPEGRIQADTSHQIFIEQSIEAARGSADSSPDERPPSPSDFTLVTESADEAQLMLLLQDSKTTCEPPVSNDQLQEDERETDVLVRVDKDTGMTTSNLHDTYTEHVEERRTETSQSQTMTFAATAIRTDIGSVESSFSSDMALLQTYDHPGDTNTISNLSSDNYETELQPEKVSEMLGLSPEESPVLHASLEEAHRLKSSSYEDIYVGTKFPGEDDDEIVLTGDIVGDRFDTKHSDMHLASHKARTSSSFENLYEETSVKEASIVEEKDVDEKGSDEEIDLDRPEKGDAEGAKEEEVMKSGEPHAHVHFTDSVTVLSDADDAVEGTDEEAPVVSSSPHSPPPIDKTFESGLDQIGQSEDMQSRDTLERSHSFEIHTTMESESDSQRHRHFSSPDDVMQLSGHEVVATQETISADAWIDDKAIADETMSTSSSEMAQVDDVLPETLTREDADTKSEETDVEEPFSPSTKECFDLEKLSGSSLTHSPPDDISPFQDVEMKDDLSPVYSFTKVSSKVKVAVGHSPSEYISEEPIFPGVHAQTDVIKDVDESAMTDSGGSDYQLRPEPVLHVGLSPMTEQEPDLAAVEEENDQQEKTVTCPPSVAPEIVFEQDELSPCALPQPHLVETPVVEPDQEETLEADERKSFMSFDNIAFAGKDHIDAEPEGQEADEDGMEVQMSEVPAEVDIQMPELLPNAPVCDFEGRVRRNELEHITADDSSGTIEFDYPSKTDSDVDKRDDEYDNVTDETVREPHEHIKETYEAAVIENILERHTHDFPEVPNEPISLEDFSFSQEQLRSQRCEMDQFEFYSTVHKETTAVTREVTTGTTNTVVVPPASLTGFPSPMEESSTPEAECGGALVSQNSLDEATAAKPLKVINQETVQVVAPSPETSIDRTESASLDSEEMEEPYGDQKDAMAAEMQVDILPSPQTPQELLRVRPVSLSDEGVVSDGERGIDDDNGEHQSVPVVYDTAEAGDESAQDDVTSCKEYEDVSVPRLDTTKAVGSLSSEEIPKTSSSSEASAEPTILAATYDLDLGAISRVVASYDVSPDTVEKTLTVEAQAKVILSSPEDDVFESELLERRLADDDNDDADERVLVYSMSPDSSEGTETGVKPGRVQERGMDESESPEDETMKDVAAADTCASGGSSPFEIVSSEDLSGFDSFVMSMQKTVTLVSEKSLTEAAGRSTAKLSLDEESYSFEHSSPISSSEPSEARGPISPFEAPVVDQIPAAPEETPAAVSTANERIQTDEDSYVHANGPTEVEYSPGHQVTTDTALHTLSSETEQQHTFSEDEEQPAAYEHFLVETQPPEMDADAVDQLVDDSLAEGAGFHDSVTAIPELADEVLREFEIPKEELMFEPLESETTPTLVTSDLSTRDVVDQVTFESLTDQAILSDSSSLTREQELSQQVLNEFDIPKEQLVFHHFKSEPIPAAIHEVEFSDFTVRTSGKAALESSASFDMFVDVIDDVGGESPRDTMSTPSPDKDTPADKPWMVKDLPIEEEPMEAVQMHEVEEAPPMRELMPEVDYPDDDVEYSEEEEIESAEEDDDDDAPAEEETAEPELIALAEPADDPPQLEDETYEDDDVDVNGESKPDASMLAKASADDDFDMYDDDDRPKSPVPDEEEHMIFDDDDKELDELIVSPDVTDDSFLRAHASQFVSNLMEEAQIAMKEEFVLTEDVAVKGTVSFAGEAEVASDGKQQYVETESKDFTPASEPSPIIDDEMKCAFDDEQASRPQHQSEPPEEQHKVKMEDVRQTFETSSDVRGEHFVESHIETNVTSGFTKVTTERTVETTTKEMEVTCESGEVLIECKRSSPAELDDSGTVVEEKEVTMKTMHETTSEHTSMVEHDHEHRTETIFKSDDDQIMREVTAEKQHDMSTTAELASAIAGSITYDKEVSKSWIEGDEEVIEVEHTSSSHHVKDEHQEREEDILQESSEEHWIEAISQTSKPTSPDEGTDSDEYVLIKEDSTITERRGGHHVTFNIPEDHQVVTTEDPIDRAVDDQDTSSSCETVMNEKEQHNLLIDFTSSSKPLDGQNIPHDEASDVSEKTKLMSSSDDDWFNYQEESQPEELLISTTEPMEKQNNQLDQSAKNVPAAASVVVVDSTFGIFAEMSAPCYEDETRHEPNASTVTRDTDAPVSLSAAVEARELHDLQSPEDTGDSSSVDSFATVVAIQPETEEDRLADIASMTSSFTSDMQSSYHEEYPEPAVSIDVRGPETFEYDDDDMSSESDDFEMIDKEELERSIIESGHSPDDEAYGMIERDVEVVAGLPALASITEEEEKGSSGERSSSSERMTLSDSSDKLGSSPDMHFSSDKLVSSPDVHFGSPGIATARFFNKSSERDDVSVSSSLLEFESLETAMTEKHSSEDSLPARIDSQAIYGRSLEKDNSSLSSSLAEFERLERDISQGDSLERMPRSDSNDKVSAGSKDSLEVGSSSSLTEFERLERELLSESAQDDRLDKCSFKSSSSSLDEFERLEAEVKVDVELEAEAQKVVNLLESGALPIMPERFEHDYLDRSSISQEQSPDVMQFSSPEDISMISSPQGLVQAEAEMDRDSLGEPETEYPHYQDIVHIIREASKNVESFDEMTQDTETHTLRTDSAEEAIKSTGQDTDADSLDGCDDHPDSDEGAVAPIMFGGMVVPAEMTTKDIDRDSLQDEESHSKSGALDSDSLQDPDSVMQVSAESVDMDQAVTGNLPGGARCGIMETSADSLCGIPALPVSFGPMFQSSDSATMDMAMQRSVDSLDAVKYEENMMERSTDSLDFDTPQQPTIPSSLSRESFDKDSLHEEAGTMATSTGSLDISAPRNRRHMNIMEMSMESGAFSQSSSVMSSETLVSTDRDIMRMSIDSPEMDKAEAMSEQTSVFRESNVQCEVREERSMSTTKEHHVAHHVSVEAESKSLVDTQDNLARSCKRDPVDTEGNVRSTSREYATCEPGVGVIRMSSGAASSRIQARETVTSSTIVQSESTRSMNIELTEPAGPSPIPSPPSPTSKHSLSSPTTSSPESSHSDNCYCGADTATTSTATLGGTSPMGGEFTAATCTTTNSRTILSSGEGLLSSSSATVDPQTGDEDDMQTTSGHQKI